MIRNVLGVFVGLIVGSMVNMGLIQLNMSVLHPAPADLDPNDMAAFAAYIETLPTTAFLVVMLAHLGQSFVGGLVAAAIGTSHRVVLALVVGVFSMAGGIMMMLMVPGPVWMWIEVPLYLVTAWAGAKVVMARLGDG